MTAIEYIDDIDFLIYNQIKNNPDISKKSLGIIFSIYDFNTFGHIDKLLERGDICEIYPNKYRVLQ